MAESVFDQLGRIGEVSCVIKGAGLDLVFDDVDQALCLGNRCWFAEIFASRSRPSSMM